MRSQDTNKNFIKSVLLKVWFKDNEWTDMLVWQTLSIFDDRIQTEILSELSDNQMQEFDKIISDNISDKEIYDFFSKSIKDFDVFMDWLYSKFEKMYISEYKNSLNNQ